MFIRNKFEAVMSDYSVIYQFAVFTNMIQNDEALHLLTGPTA